MNDPIYITGKCHYASITEPNTKFDPVWSIQIEVAKPDIESFTKITKEAMYTTQKILDFKCDLDSDFKVGNNWAETH